MKEQSKVMKTKIKKKKKMWGGKHLRMFDILLCSSYVHSSSNFSYNSYQGLWLEPHRCPEVDRLVWLHPHRHTVLETRLLQMSYPTDCRDWLNAPPAVCWECKFGALTKLDSCLVNPRRLLPSPPCSPSAWLRLAAYRAACNFQGLSKLNCWLNPPPRNLGKLNQTRVL